MCVALVDVLVTVSTFHQEDAPMICQSFCRRGSKFGSDDGRSCQYQVGRPSLCEPTPRARARVQRVSATVLGPRALWTVMDVAGENTTLL